MTTRKEIMTAAHKIAGNINILGDYSVRLSIGLKVAYKLAKIMKRIDDNLNDHFVNITTNGVVTIHQSYCAIYSNQNDAIALGFVGQLINLNQKETESQKFTRLAVVNFNKVA